MRIFADVIGFQWDDGNRDKNLNKHGVTNDECEEVFQDQSRQVYPDLHHSLEEQRHLVVGETQRGTILIVAFTFREKHIRIISARPINRKERKMYE